MSDDLKAVIREKYGRAAEAAAQGGSSCCGERGERDPITRDLYAPGETAALPAEAVAASLGCGNPTALAALAPGETVLDLGSGGGIDVLLSARRVGPTGRAYGLDMTDQMLALARENARRAGITNVEFLEGEIERIPLPDASVDVIISNCVINLSPDKDRVLAEAFRVLRPGGRFAVSDVVVRGPVPADVRRSVELWIGCVAGALEEGEYRAKLAGAGFADVEIEPTRVYRVEDARDTLAGAGLDVERIAPLIDGKFMSAFVRARKPKGDRPMQTVPRVHVHMKVADLEKSRAFYERFLGVAPVKVKPGYVKFLPPFGPLNLALSQAAPGTGVGPVDHLGLQVESRAIVLRELGRVKAAGLPVREEIGVDCCHANQDKFWVADPDGVEWEVYVLNYDLEEGSTVTPPATAPAARGLAVVKAGGCCSSS
jgi:SAM-dependent methyltransferase